MALPVRSLPVLQNWDCHSCTGCCREYLVTVTPVEKKRIESQNWDQDPAMKGRKLFSHSGKFWKRQTILNHEADGSCVFLNESGGCRIHAKFGSEGKPLACRIYPFMLVPCGDHWKVGLRFACPSAANDQGRPLDKHQSDVQQFAELIEKQEGIAKTLLPAPRLQRAQSAPWSDLFHFVRAFRGIISNKNHPLEFRLRKSLALIKLCRQARFDIVTGRKLVEFLELVSDGIEEEFPEHPNDLKPPSWIGNILFRQMVAIYARKDAGLHRGISRRGRLALLWAAWRFARGEGTIPALNSMIPVTTFADVEKPQGAIPSTSEAMLTRFFLVKLESMQFTGPTNYQREFWDGLESLIALFPVILWLSRVFHNQPREEAITLALRIVDDNYGFNPLLGNRRQLMAQRIMASQGELAKLIAWYSR